MKSKVHAWVALVSSLLVVQAAQGQGASERVDKWMQPPTKISGAGPKPQRATPRSLENPQPALPLADLLPPQVPPLPASPMVPRRIGEPPPLQAWLGEPGPAVEGNLPDGAVFVQQGTTDAKLRELPSLADYARDRASLSDPSWVYSMAAILQALEPARKDAVPFSPWNLPDPFEHAKVVRLRESWPESSTLPPVNAGQ